MSVAEHKQKALPTRLDLLKRRYRALMVLEATGGIANIDLDDALVECGQEIERLSQGSGKPIPRELRSKLDHCRLDIERAMGEFREGHRLLSKRSAKSPPARRALGKDGGSACVPEASPSGQRLPFRLPVAPLSLESYRGSSGEEKDRFHIKVYEENEAWIARELDERGAEWILVLGGEVRRWSSTLDDYPSPKELSDFAAQERQIPFVFVRSHVIEETVWLSLGDSDYYPTLQLSGAFSSGQPHRFAPP